MIQFKNFLTQLFSRLSADERVRIGCISFIFMHSSLLAINSLDNFKSLSFAILFFLATTFALCAQNLQVLGKVIQNLKRNSKLEKEFKIYSLKFTDFSLHLKELYVVQSVDLVLRFLLDICMISNLKQ